MSTINVNEIRDTTGSENIAPAIPALEPRLVQAWVNFSGAGVPSIRGSFNVSSITDLGTGSYRVNYTTNISNIAYSVSVTGNVSQAFPVALALESTNIATRTTAGNNTDATQIFLQAFSN